MVSFRRAVRSPLRFAKLKTRCRRFLSTRAARRSRSQSGFMCMMFYRRDVHVAEIQMGTPANRLEDACAPDHFDVAKLPFITLLGEWHGVAYGGGGGGGGGVLCKQRDWMFNQFVSLVFRAANNPESQICPLQGLYALRGAVGPPYISSRHKRNHNSKAHSHHHHATGHRRLVGIAVVLRVIFEIFLHRRYAISLIPASGIRRSASAIPMSSITPRGERIRAAFRSAAVATRPARMSPRPHKRQHQHRPHRQHRRPAPLRCQRQRAHRRYHRQPSSTIRSSVSPTTMRMAPIWMGWRRHHNRRAVCAPRQRAPATGDATRRRRRAIAATRPAV